MSKRHNANLISMSEGYPEVKVYKLSPEQRRVSAELQRYYRAKRKEKQIASVATRQDNTEASRNSTANDLTLGDTVCLFVAH